MTLWEALYGELPFEPGPRPKLLVDVIEGKRRAPPEGSTVPRWLRAACEQGLSVDPAGRWPSMDVLLDALD